MARLTLRTPRVVEERVEPRNHDDRDRDAEQRRIVSESKHDLESALNSATAIWGEIAGNVLKRIDTVEAKLDEVLDGQRASNREREDRSTKEAEREARHRRRIANAKVLALFFVPVLVAMTGAIASHYWPSATPAAPASSHH